jgi:hypothetical protein
MSTLDDPRSNIIHSVWWSSRSHDLFKRTITVLGRLLIDGDVSSSAMFARPAGWARGPVWVVHDPFVGRERPERQHVLCVCCCIFVGATVAR